MSATRKAELGTRKRATARTFQRRQLNAGALTVSIELDGSGHLHAVHLPKRIPVGLSADDLAEMIAELQRHTLAIDPAPPFHRRVWTKLRAIPSGKTLTYGRIANALGSPRASRAVGQACAANRLALVIPCHRVVGVSGPGGFAWGLAWKAKLLELETKQAPTG